MQINIVYGFFPARIHFKLAPEWKNGYYYEIPEKMKELTLGQYFEINNAKPTTLAEYREATRKHGLKDMLLEEEEPETEEPLPEKYHFFDKYPMCLKEEWNQNTCGSCWAFAAATTMTHRLCKAIVDAGYHPTGKDEVRDFKLLILELQMNLFNISN